MHWFVHYIICGGYIKTCLFLLLFPFTPHQKFLINGSVLCWAEPTGQEFEFDRKWKKIKSEKRQSRMKRKAKNSARKNLANI